MQLLLPRLARIHCHSKDVNVLRNSVLLRTLSSTYYDVVISGGGLIGGSMACAIGASPHLSSRRVLLVESQPRPPMDKLNLTGPFSRRVSAISPGSRKFMERLGVWSGIARKCAVKKMQGVLEIPGPIFHSGRNQTSDQNIWDALSKSSVSFVEDDMNGDLCYIIENDLMISSMHEIMDQMKSHKFEIAYGSRIASMDLPRDYGDTGNEPLRNAHLTLTSGEKLECGLLIAADGANSTIPAKADIPKVSIKYEQSAVVATLKLDKPTENVVAWQRFLPQGPLALLPLDDEHSSLVWSTSHQRCKKLMSMSGDDLVKEINSAFLMNRQSNIVKYAEDKFEEILAWMLLDPTANPLQSPPVIAEICGEPASFPLGLSHSNYYVKPRLALVGDVAHRIHPLAGQGANLGFRDVDCLVEELEHAVEIGSDLGSMSHLTRFESIRQLDNTAFCIATDNINRLYSTKSEPMVMLRSLGLMAVAATEPLKEFLKKRAMS